MEITTFHPLILKLLKTHKEDDVLLKESLRLLECTIMRRMISGAETKSYNKICKLCIDDPSLFALRSLGVADSDVAKGLQRISNKAATLVLFWIELSRRSLDSKLSEADLSYNFTLEHLMPQKWEQYWSVVPIVDETNEPFKNDETAKSYRQVHIYSLGNMVLLRGSLNSSLRNFSFEEKMLGVGKKKGIKHYAATLLIVSDDVQTAFDNGDKVWNEAKIRTRTKALTAETLKLWPA